MDKNSVIDGDACANLLDENLEINWVNNDDDDDAPRKSPPPPPTRWARYSYDVQKIIKDGLLAFTVPFIACCAVKIASIMFGWHI